MSTQSISDLLKHTTLFFPPAGNICHIWPKRRSVLVPVPAPFAIAFIVCWQKNCPFYCASLDIPFHCALGVGRSAAAACTAAGSSTPCAAPQDQGAGCCDCTGALVRATGRHVRASHKPRLCLQREEGNLPPRLQLPLRAQGEAGN